MWVLEWKRRYVNSGHKWRGRGIQGAIAIVSRGKAQHIADTYNLLGVGEGLPELAETAHDLRAGQVWVLGRVRRSSLLDELCGSDAGP